MYKQKTFKIPVYNFSFVVAVSNTHEELNKRKPNILMDIEPQMVACTWNGFSGRRAVMTFMAAFIINAPSGHLTHGTIAHECNHIADSLLHGIGEHDAGALAGEQASYLKGWLVDAVYNMFSENKLLKYIKIEKI